MMDSASAVVEFKVNYEQSKHLPAGQAIKSDDISVGGQVWRINFYPRGAYEIPGMSNDHFSIFLERKINYEITTPIKSIFEVLLIDKDGTPVMISSKLPPPLQRYYGNYQWLASQNYMVKNYVKDGHIKFVFTITVLPDNPIPVPPSDIGKDIGTLLDNTDGMDVSFVVDGETFQAHRAVLAARSPVFRAELLGSMAEATMPCITLHDITPATFRAMLQFMYTDVLPGESELVASETFMYSPTEIYEHLLVAADRYALDRMKLLCAQKLWEKVSVDTVCDTLVCAEIYNCRELKDKCIGFVAEDRNFRKIVLTDSFMQLGQRFPPILEEVRKRVAGTM
ncbi:unnamed protein product [Urochloa humidicola]